MKSAKREASGVLIVAVAIGCASAPSARTLLAAEPAPAAASREYKIRLRPDAFDEKTERENLWRVLAGKDGATAVPEGAINAKQCRRISFLDTSSKAIFGAGRILRKREKLKSEKCSGTAKAVEFTFKARGDEKQLQGVFAEEWTKSASVKVEEDRLVGVGREPKTVLSVSDDSEAEGAVAKVQDAQARFKGALPGFPSDESLEPSCRVVFELQWSLENLDLPEGMEAPELAFWQWAGDGNGAGAA